MTESELTKLLETLIAKWENEVIEFKSAGKGFSTDDIGKYFSALSNEANLHRYEKAWLVFGVDNKSRTVRGTDYTCDPDYLNRLKVQIKDGTVPRVSLNEIHVLSHSEGRVILFEIPAAPQGIPIAWKGHYYARAGESLVPMGLEQLERIRKQGLEQDWSAQFVPEATFEDLDPEALQTARKGFTAKYANRFSEDEVQNWPIETFLDRAQVTRQGRITRTTLLLLGKEESAHLLNPHPAQMTWKLEGQERAYEHFGPPFLLNTSKLFNRIRNIQIRILPEKTLLAVEVAKYDQKVVLEGLHNCLAHQDYTKNSRIIVTEYLDRLTMQNAGSFFEGDPMDYIYGEKTPSRYRNTMLVQAMTKLNMIDSMGYGIHDMFIKQAERGFPLQDYTETQDSVTVTIYGHIIDEAYSSMLLRKTNLKPDEIICLDRIQKGLELPADAEDVLRELRKAHLVEGRRPHIRISQDVEQVVSNLREQSQKQKKDGYVLAMGAQAEQGAQAGSTSMSFGILNHLLNGSKSKKELASLLNVKSGTGNYKRTIQLLLKLKLIEPTKIKNRNPNQTYRITEQGKKHLTERMQ